MKHWVLSVALLSLVAGCDSEPEEPEYTVPQEMDGVWFVNVSVTQAGSPEGAAVASYQTPVQVIVNENTATIIGLCPQDSRFLIAQPQEDNGVRWYGTYVCTPPPMGFANLVMTEGQFRYENGTLNGQFTGRYATPTGQGDARIIVTGRKP